MEAMLHALGRAPIVGVRIPYVVGYLGGIACDMAAAVTGRKLPISAIRIRKFCTTTTFAAYRVESTGFEPPIGLREALVMTVRHETRKGVGSDGPNGEYGELTA